MYRGYTAYGELYTNLINPNYVSCPLSRSVLFKLYRLEHN